MVYGPEILEEADPEDDVSRYGYLPRDFSALAYISDRQMRRDILDIVGILTARLADETYRSSEKPTRVKPVTVEERQQIHRSIASLLQVNSYSLLEQYNLALQLMLAVGPDDVADFWKELGAASTTTGNIAYAVLERIIEETHSPPDLNAMLDYGPDGQDRENTDQTRP